MRILFLKLILGNILLVCTLVVDNDKRIFIRDRSGRFAKGFGFRHGFIVGSSCSPDRPGRMTVNTITATTPVLASPVNHLPQAGSVISHFTWRAALASSLLLFTIICLHDISGIYP